MGECDTTEAPVQATNSGCEIGFVAQLRDNNTNWVCRGAGGDSERCFVPENGVCGNAKDECSSGNHNDIANTAKHFKWQCMGSNGGTTASCEKGKDVGVCNLNSVNPQNDGCRAGTYRRHAFDDTRWLCVSDLSIECDSGLSGVCDNTEIPVQRSGEGCARGFVSQLRDNNTSWICRGAGGDSERCFVSAVIGRCDNTEIPRQGTNDGCEEGHGVVSRVRPVSFVRESKVRGATSNERTLNFGAREVAVDGDTAIIGSHDWSQGSNSVFIFKRTNFRWLLQQRLRGGAGTDSLGYSVAIKGNIAIAGDPQNGLNGTHSGAAYIYTRSDNRWTLQQILRGARAYDYFGSSVAINGNIIVIGAYGNDNNNGVNAGAAYVYTQSNNNWIQRSKILGEGGHFGLAVAMDGNTIIVGARDHNSKGAAYFYLRDGTSWTWLLREKMINTISSSRFGSSVAIDGDTAIVGAEWENRGNVIKSGAAYIYKRDGVSWTLQKKIIGKGREDWLGHSVGIDGDVAIIGAPQILANDKGIAYIYTRATVSGQDVWSQEKRIFGEVIGDDFGFAVAVDGDTVVVGARDHPFGNWNTAGAAYFYRGKFVWTCRGAGGDSPRCRMPIAYCHNGGTDAQCAAAGGTPYIIDEEECKICRFSRGRPSGRLATFGSRCDTTFLVADAPPNERK